ncbi:MAG: type I restriction-modification system subunit M N-terminal domain-containing protein, partial [Deltaproteobacteria bacterium]|nr:type I restriction-modification system subunit M N-terminal domain-containing protein [Deltaproteobacteria bacterium]
MPRHTLFHSNKLSQPLEKTLWEAADILRKNIDAAEYKHVVLGLIFLRYISDTFETLYQVFKQDGQDPENPVGYA